MVNTKTKFPRGIWIRSLAQEGATAHAKRAPGPGLKVTSYKLPGPKPISNANKGLIHKHQASSDKLREIQASSGKHQAPSSKHQATSHKQQAPGSGTLEKVSSTFDQGSLPR
jgi:hypothetical protein